jgi:hypothetical protein
MDIRSLVEAARSRGVAFKLDGDRIKVEARTEPDGETKALLESLRGHKDELRSVLAAPDCWNCGATMTRTRDVSGNPWWACWECAKTI